MRAFVTVAKLGSFSAAARELGFTPGLMSKQIKQLEDGLDVRLLQRTTRGVSLTDAGELYVGHVIDILQRIDDADTAVTGLAAGPRGILRISCPHSFGTHVLTPAIAAFAQLNPQISVELGLQDDEPNVVASRLDLIFRLGSLRDSTLVAKHIGNAPFILCASPTYLRRCGMPQGLPDLTNFNCIVDGSIQLDGQWEFVRDQRRVAQAVHGNFSSLSTEAVIEASTEGLGIAYVPRYAVTDELERGEIVALGLVDTETISMPLFVLYGSRAHIAAKTRAFLDFSVAFISARAGMAPVARGGLGYAAAGGVSPNTDNREQFAEDLAI